MGSLKSTRESRPYLVPKRAVYRTRMKDDKTSNQTAASDSPSCQWFSNKQSQFSFSKIVTSELETARFHGKQLESLYREPDSSSTLSTGESHTEATTMARSNLSMQNVSFQPGFFETPKTKDSMTPPVACETADYASHHTQLELNQSPAYVSYPSYDFGGIIASYGPSSMVYSQMMGITPARVALPLECTEGPTYVNAKQYHAILRRRQTRARLEARNRMAKSKKPYLHESRHLHALKRARGTGGRFLNTKNVQQTKCSPQMHDKYLSLQMMNNDPYEPEIQHSGSNCSDVSDIFNNDDIFQPHEFNDSISSFPTGANSRGPAPDDRLMLYTAT